jgi:hypothetical protein
MDKLTEYPQLIQRILNEYVELCDRRPNPNLETFLVVDEPRNPVSSTWGELYNLNTSNRLQ